MKTQRGRACLSSTTAENTPRKVKIYTRNTHTHVTYTRLAFRLLDMYILLYRLSSRLLLNSYCSNFSTKQNLHIIPPYLSLSLSLYHSCIDLFTFPYSSWRWMLGFREFIWEKSYWITLESVFFFVFLFFLQMTSIIFDCFREYFFINNGYFALKIALNVEPSNGHYYMCSVH